ncbi:hypothetical protein GCM10022252_05110 [Streptosporangium oxazolinicum]|uniref:Uncharacterized protein n=2 Tax=Streptosporangium oxazolinicum TaxID=909287 RepID=A0ABP8ABM3_9ACTN
MTAAELVSSVIPADDDGAPTADRYDWQAAMAAADGLRLYQDGLGDDGRLRPECEDWILCEWQEDWILISGEIVELVSGKHRDTSAGAYTTINKLADDGGLAHLFSRWAALKERVLCRLVTSGGLAAGDPRHLLNAMTSLRSTKPQMPHMSDFEHRIVVGKLRTAINTHCEVTKERWSGSGVSVVVPDDERDIEVARFLAALSIHENQIQRDHIAYAAPGMFVQPVLDKMQVSAPADAVWSAVLAVFQSRMRGRGRLPIGELPSVLQRGNTYKGFPSDLARKLQMRTVTMSDIEQAIHVAAALPGGYAQLPPLPPTSRLEVKLDVSGCSANTIERARSLRMAYRDYWSDRESGDPTARVERLRLERRLQRLSDEATDTLQPQGASLWRRLQELVDALDPMLLPPGMDADLVMGGICDLTDQCMIWFGPRFDVDVVLERGKLERRTSA